MKNQLAEVTHWLVKNQLADLKSSERVTLCKSVNVSSSFVISLESLNEGHPDDISEKTVSWSLRVLLKNQFSTTRKLREVALCQQHVRRELQPERHWVKEQKPPVEQTCRKLEMVQGGACQYKTSPRCVTSSRLPATWRQIQNAHERNHAEPPTWLGLESTVNGCSKTFTSAIS